MAFTNPSIPEGIPNEVMPRQTRNKTRGISWKDRMESFQDIFYGIDLNNSGKCRLAESGLGWKPLGGGETFTFDKDSLLGPVTWSRVAKGYELKFDTRTKGLIKLCGFKEENFSPISKAFKLFYDINVEKSEHSIRGHNWGKAELGKHELTFKVQNRPAFEIPYSQITNTNLAGKNEIQIDLAVPAGDKNEPGTSGADSKKVSVDVDCLTEIRFFIPGMSKKGEDDEDEEQPEVVAFHDELADKAEIGEVVGEVFATFLDVLHLTPRGRFDIDMLESSFRLRGKTYDYKIQFDRIKKLMLLPKPDDLHTLIVIGLDPPLRQGQTRYPFLVMQFKREEEVTIDLNIPDELLEGKFKDKLLPHYEAPQHSVVAQVFRGLVSKKVITPSKDFLSHHGQAGVKCSIKANEGHLFMLDKSFMFVPKPSTYILFDNIAVIVMSRVGGAVSASRTFDITITTKSGGGDHQFSNINREEQKSLEEFFQAKGLKTRNEMLDDSAALIQAALNDADINSSEEDVVAAKANRGSADEDSESDDEDFQTDDDSDVAEEYDSAHESSGSGEGSDVEMGDAGEVEGGKKAGGRAEEPKKKKVKTSK